MAGKLAFALEWGSFSRLGGGQVRQEQRARVWIPIAKSVLDDFRGLVRVRNRHLLFLLDGLHRLSEATQGRLSPLELDDFGYTSLTTPGRALDEVPFRLHLLDRCEPPDVKAQLLAIELLQSLAQ